MNKIHKNAKQYNEVKSNIDKNNCTLLTEESFYKNSRTSLNIMCSCGEIFTTTYKIFSRKRNPQNKCPKCLNLNYRNNIKQFYFEIKNKILLEGHILLTSFDDYVNTKTKLKILCPKEHVYFKSWNKFNEGQRCTICSKKKKYTYIEVKSIIESEGYELLSKEYVNCKKELLIKCDKGHIFEMCFDFFNNAKCRCPECNISSGELRIRDFMLKNNINFIQQYKFKDCKNKNSLPFDFSIFDINNNLLLLIEYQGQQHYKPVDIFGGDERFKYQQKLDKIKNIYCLKNNLPLLRIPYWDFDKIEQILSQELIKYKLTA